MTANWREEIFNKWREAYRKANGKEPPMIFKTGNGWYQIEHSSYRISQFPAMTERLLERVKDEPT